MNSKDVLKKIMTMLSAEQTFAEARLADGTVLESPTFDVGETVDVVTEEGKTPAPDGEHEIALRDEEGNEVLIKIETENGVITERENVELPEAEEERIEEELQAEEETEEVEPLTEDMAKKMEDLAYRIEEMEKKIQKMEEEFLPVDEERVSEGEGAEVVEAKPLTEELSNQLPKLDGAPVEERKPLYKLGNRNHKLVNPQGAFLSKLYN